MSQLVTLSQAETRARQLRRQGRRIILVTGVFDLFHQEHKKFLQAAKKIGGTLFVGVETDARVRQLKGAGRPIWPLLKRLQQLTQFPAVDYVFALPKQFNRREDHEGFMRKMKPDILAISEYTPHQEVKRQLVEKYGGRLKIVLAHNPRVSTSQLVKEKKPTSGSAT